MMEQKNRKKLIPAEGLGITKKQKMLNLTNQHKQVLIDQLIQIAGSHSPLIEITKSKPSVEEINSLFEFLTVRDRTYDDWYDDGIILLDKMVTFGLILIKIDTHDYAFGSYHEGKLPKSSLPKGERLNTKELGTKMKRLIENYKSNC